MTRVNTEVAMVCLISMVEDLIANKTGPMDRPKWLSNISPGFIKMKSFVELVSQRVELFMTFLNLMVSFIVISFASSAYTNFIRTSK